MNIHVVNRVVLFGMLWDIDTMLQAMGRLGVLRGIVAAPVTGDVNLLWWQEDVDASMRESGRTTADFQRLLDASQCMRAAMKIGELGDEYEKLAADGAELCIDVAPTCRQLRAPACDFCLTQQQQQQPHPPQTQSGGTLNDWVHQSMTSVTLNATPLVDVARSHGEWLQSAFVTIRNERRRRGSFCAVCWSSTHNQGVSEEYEWQIVDIYANLNRHEYRSARTNALGDNAASRASSCTRTAPVGRRQQRFDNAIPL